MLLNLYSTAARGEPLAHGPSLIIASDHVGALPGHPSGKTWRYLATISSADRLIASGRAVIEVALAGHGFLATRWALGMKPEPSQEPHPRRLRIASDGRGRSVPRQLAEQAFHLPG